MENILTHTPVLVMETLTELALAPTDTIVDGTFGGGGHSAVLRTYIPEGFLICVDLDEAARERFEKRFGLDTHAVFVQANFKDVQRILTLAGKTQVDKVLLDLGTSTYQLLADTRGFSFQSDAPLAMTFSEAPSHTGFRASDIVNSWQESSIADIIYYYGGETKARVIARAIVEARKLQPITTSSELASIITKVLPRRGKVHPATKTFQALRIAVNDEIGILPEALDQWLAVLRPGGRIAVITFHSLEDRTIKRWMKEHTGAGRVITKKAIKPSRDEVLNNPRARSATLRVFEKHPQQ
jgi:16S rRNA (cytosine1402-N4)-methyltransferase